MWMSPLSLAPGGRRPAGWVLWESHSAPESPALRLLALQSGFPPSEPRMNIRTIYLAIWVVKITLSDTRFKVTGMEGAGVRNTLRGKQRVSCGWSSLLSHSVGGGRLPQAL